MTPIQELSSLIHLWKNRFAKPFEYQPPDSSQDWNFRSTIFIINNVLDKQNPNWQTNYEWRNFLQNNVSLSLNHITNYLVTRQTLELFIKLYPNSLGKNKLDLPLSVDGFLDGANFEAIESIIQENSIPIHELNKLVRTDLAMHVISNNGAFFSVDALNYILDKLNVNDVKHYELIKVILLYYPINYIDQGLARHFLSNAIVNNKIELVRLVLDKNKGLFTNILYTAISKGKTQLVYDILNWASEKALITGEIISRAFQEAFKSKNFKILDLLYPYVSLLLSNDILKIMATISEKMHSDFWNERLTPHNQKIYNEDYVYFLKNVLPLIDKEVAKKILFDAYQPHFDGECFRIMVLLILHKFPLLYFDNTDQRGNKNTLFHAAADKNQTEIVDIILNLREKFRSNGVDLKNLIQAKNNEGDTALHIAANKGDSEEMVKRILDECPELIPEKNKKDETALHIAVKNGHRHIFRMILEKNPDLILAQDLNGNTALHFLLYLWSPQAMVELLFRQVPKNLLMKALFDIKNNLGKTVLLEAATSTKKGKNKAAYSHTWFFNFILENFQDTVFNYFDPETGDTIFHVVAAVGNAEIMKVLLKKVKEKMIINEREQFEKLMQKNKSESTPLKIALRLDQPNACSYTKVLTDPQKSKSTAMAILRFLCNPKQNKKTCLDDIRINRDLIKEVWEKWGQDVTAFGPNGLSQFFAELSLSNEPILQ